MTASLVLAIVFFFALATVRSQADLPVVNAPLALWPPHLRAYLAGVTLVLGRRAMNDLLPSDDPPVDARGDERASLPLVDADLRSPARFVARAPLPPASLLCSDLAESRFAEADPALVRLADALADPRTQTPLALAVVGAPGSGKSSALAFLSEAAPAQARARGVDLTVLRIDAADVAQEPEAEMAAALFRALCASPGREGQPACDAALARAALDAADGLRDLQAEAREESERLSQMRLALETERQNLDAAAGKRARVVEAVLFERQGARFDAWGRAHRNLVERRLRAFGFDRDPLAAWKECVREAAERGPRGIMAIGLRALAFGRGQGALVVSALAAFVCAWAIGLADAASPQWIAGLQSAGSSGLTKVGDWIGGHPSLFVDAQKLFDALGAACLLALCVRVALFLAPILRGAALLRGDIDARRREIDALLAHQTRCVDELSRKIEAQAARVEAAERRASQPRTSTTSVEALRGFGGLEAEGASARRRFARDFMANFEQGLAAGAHRLVICLDGLECLSPERAAGVFLAASRMFKRAGMILAHAVDPDQFHAAFGAGARQQAARLFQLTLRLEADDSAAFAREAQRADEALSTNEWSLVCALADCLDASPRARKAFSNAYRFARAVGGGSSADAGALALALLEASRAFASAPELRDVARRAIAAAGVSVAADQIARWAPLARRLRPL